MSLSFAGYRVNEKSAATHPGGQPPHTQQLPRNRPPPHQPHERGRHGLSGWVEALHARGTGPGMPGFPPASPPPSHANTSIPPRRRPQARLPPHSPLFRRNETSYSYEHTLIRSGRPHYTQPLSFLPPSPSVSLSPPPPPSRSMLGRVCGDHRGRNRTQPTRPPPLAKPAPARGGDSAPARKPPHSHQPARQNPSWLTPKTTLAAPAAADRAAAPESSRCPRRAATAPRAARRRRQARRVAAGRAPRAGPTRAA